MRRKRIAALMAGLNREYQREFALGMSREARALDVDLCIFTCQGATQAVDSLNERNNAAIYDLPALNDFDGIVLLSFTVATEDARRHLRELLTRLSDKPQVSVDGGDPQALRLSFEDESSVRELTRHLVQKHGKRDFVVISGPRCNAIAEARLTMYLDGLRDEGIQVCREDILDGGWTREGGRTAAMEILRRRGDRMPQGILCANDDSAFGVIDVLEEHHLRVPEDVVVTGFDAKHEAVARGLTTIRRPARDAGHASVRMLVDWMEGHKPESMEISMATELIYGDSCGCAVEDDRARRFVRMLCGEHWMMERSLVQTSDFSSALASVSSNGELGEVIGRFARGWKIREMHVCVDPQFQSRDEAEHMTSYPERMSLLTSYSQGRLMPQCEFETRRLLPLLEESREEAITMVFCPLYYAEHLFGYAVVDLEFSASLALYPLLTTLGDGLMGLRLRGKVTSYAKALERMIVHDPLTGLMNRRGFQVEAKRLLRKAREEKQAFVLLSADMDGMKEINDQFGHLSGDKAICRMGEAAQLVEAHGFTSVHISGDEFLVMGVMPPDADFGQLSQWLEEALEKVNRDDPWVFDIAASMGIYAAVPREGDTVDEFQSRADRLMYENKRRRKAARE